jgi:predicted nucleic acid-binding protein
VLVAEGRCRRLATVVRAGSPTRTNDPWIAADAAAEAGVPIWTLDRRFAAVAAELGVGAEPAP